MCKMCSIDGGWYSNRVGYYVGNITEFYRILAFFWQLKNILRKLGYSKVEN